MKTYFDFGSALRVGGSDIPKDPASTDYRRALNEVAQGQAEILPRPDLLTEEQKHVIARRNYETFISRYFSIHELMHMIVPLIQGKAKATASYGWIQQGVTEAMVNFENPNFTQFGEPPYWPNTYAEVITE